MTATVRGRRLFTVRRVVVSLLLALSAVGFVVAFTMHHETAPPVISDGAVVTLYPKPGALVQRQTTVFYELDPSYQGTLSIDGHAIPDDQIERIAVGRTRIGYTPGPGKELARLPPGRVCAIASFWPLGQSPATARSVPWCFNLS